MFILYSFNGVEEYAVEDHEIAKLTKPLFNLLGGFPNDLVACQTILKFAKDNMKPGEITYGDPLYILERVEHYEDRKAFPIERGGRTMIWDPSISFDGFQKKVDEWYREGVFVGDPPISAQFALDLIFKTLVDDKENYPYLTTIHESTEQTNGIMLDLILTKYNRKYRIFKKRLKKRNRENP